MTPSKLQCCRSGSIRIRINDSDPDRTISFYQCWGAGAGGAEIIFLINIYRNQDDARAKKNLHCDISSISFGTTVIL